MTQFPNNLDTDIDIIRVDDSITELGGIAIDQLRDAVFAIEENLGIRLAGNEADLATRLSIAIDANGNIKPSAVTALNLVSLPIVNSQVSATAAIQESKLSLNYGTTFLYNQITGFSASLQVALSFITDTGVKVEPHLEGITYRHILNHIDIASSPSQYFKNRKGLLRDNSNLYNLFTDFNKDLVSHEKADSTDFSAFDPTNALYGTIPPANYAHVADGIFLNPANFSFVPQTTNDLQKFAEFIDNSNIFLLGTRIQTFYANGISRTARSGTPPNPLLGQLMVPTTALTTYLLYGGSSAPFDDIDHGDDIVEFTPSAPSIANSTFDAMFNLVRVGDILTTIYDGYNISVQSVIKEIKLIASGGSKRYVLRLDSKNLMAGTTFTGTVNKPLFNIQKYGVLALAQANAPINVLPSLISGNPRGAQVLGVGFNADQIDQTHYNLYLQLYRTGNPLDTNGVSNLAPIDITGNKGTTPGQYTLDFIVASTNAAFRTAGYNYRFIAYSYQGQFGLMLAEPYNNASFSIISGILNSSGAYDQALSNTAYPNNIIGTPGFDVKDALGFGPAAANLGSPPYSASFANATVAQTPTKLFVPLTRNNYYVDGVERERFALEPNQILDGYGDGYWAATIFAKTIVPGVRVEVTYQVNADLSTSKLQIGKTLVIQAPSVIDSGRFFIKNIQFNNCDMPNAYALITVYDAIHSTGVTPFASASIGTAVSLYFNSDSIGFNIENSTDYSVSGTTFKRHFEVYVDQNGNTFSHERGRMNISGSLTTINTIPLYSTTSLSFIGIYKISPKLRGYAFSSVTKINLQITSYSATTGIFSGYLCQWDGSVISNQGPVTVGKKGTVTRFYDQTNIEYIEFIFDAAANVPPISTTQNIDIQLWPTLRLDEELMLLGTVQVNTSTYQLEYLRDERQFGNTSEEQFTTSALDYIAAPTKYLSENGIIQGFNLVSITGNNITFNGGIAVVNGKIVQLGNESVGIPVVQETLVPYGQSTAFNTITWFVCLNDKGEIEFIASTDFDPTMSSGTYDLIPVDHTRIFYAINPNNILSTPYQIRATYLADIVSNFKDVTILAVVTSTIALSSGTYSVSSTINDDARRFIYNGFGGLTAPFVFGANASFRNFDSLNTWMKQLLTLKSSITNSNSVGQKVIVKGNNILTSSTTLNYGSEVIFEGDGGSFTTADTRTAFNLGNNVTFRNITFVDGYDASTDSSYNQALLANNNYGLLYCNVDTTNGNKNIKIDNCTFTTTYQYYYPFVVFNFSSVTAMAENIDIINNKFTPSYASEDKLAVISFVGPAVAPGGSFATVNGARLNNCNIINNRCNKNQLIQISAPLDLVSGNILDTIVGNNVQISNNTCGAINVLAKNNTPLSAFNTTFSSDKSEGVLVYKNNCRFIYSGLANGSAIDGYGQRSTFILGTGIFSGAFIIDSNIASFIHTGVRVPTSYASPPPNLIIKYNRLYAADDGSATGYLNDYYVGFTRADGYSYVNTAMIVDKQVGS